MPDAIKALGLPEPDFRPDALTALGIPPPTPAEVSRIRMMAAHRSTDPFAVENIAARDKPLERDPLSPADLVGGIPAMWAAKVAAETVPATSSWLAQAAMRGGRAGATLMGLDDVARGRNPASNAASNFTVSAALGPPLEAVGGAVLRGVRGLVPTRAKAPAPDLERLTAELAAATPKPKPAVAPPPAAAIEPVTTRVGPNTGPTVPQEVRLDKVGLGNLKPGETGAVPEGAALVERTLASLGMGTRKVRTFEDMRAAAQELGMDPRALLSGAAARPISDAEVVATANLINDAATLHIDATKALQSVALTETERVALTQQANGALRAIEEALKRRIKGGTEAGRAVAAFRIIGQRNMDPPYWYTVAQRRLADRPFTPELKASIDDAIAAGDRVGLARIVSRLHQPGFVDKFTTLVKAFMLSNPGTDVRNLGGNSAFNLAATVADLPAASLDMLLSVATGARSKMGPSRVQAGEVLRGTVSGVRRAGEVLRHGDTAENVLAKYDFNRDVHFDNPVLEFFTQAVFRRLGAEDYLFREPAKFRAVAELAELTAKNEGLSGQAFLKRVRDLIANPTPKMIELAEADAAYRTFNQPSAFANWLGGLERAGTAGKVIGTTVVPFKRTPINVANAVVDFSPFGIPKTVLRTLSARSRGDSQLLQQRFFVEGMGRAMTGTALAGLGWAMARAGAAVGGPPTKADEKNLRRALQVPNYAVRQGDNWVAVNNNAPMSNVFMMGVDAYEQFAADKPLADKISGTAFSAVKGMTEQTFLKGVKSASEAATDPGRFGGSWLEGVSGMVVPSLVGAVARGTDPLERRINSPLEAVQARIPGLRGNLEPQVDAAGETRRQQTGLAGQLFSPVRVSPARTDRLAQAMQAAGYAPNVPTMRETGMGKVKVKLTEGQLTQFQREVGRAQTNAMLAEIELNENFGSLAPEEQAQRLRTAADRAENRVRSQWKMSLVMDGRPPNSGSLGMAAPTVSTRAN